MFVFFGCWDKLRASGREPELLFVKDKRKHQRGKRETFAHGKRPLPKIPPPSSVLSAGHPAEKALTTPLYPPHGDPDTSPRPH